MQKNLQKPENLPAFKRHCFPAEISFVDIIAAAKRHSYAQTRDLKRADDFLERRTEGRLCGGLDRDSRGERVKTALSTIKTSVPTFETVRTAAFLFYQTDTFCN